MRVMFAIAVAFFALGGTAEAQYMGNYTANPYLPPAAPQPPNTFSNPYGTDANSPKLYDDQGNFHGNVNANPYDPNSIADPYGQYGSPYSANSVNNPYSTYGSPYSSQSPNDPYGTGMAIYGPNDSPPTDPNE
ncbi:MAG TPA: hypothetical protein VGB91_00285 [Rhizomicrobium sp.]